MSHKIEQPIQLRGGFAAEDPRLGRVPQFDEASRGFDIRATLEEHDTVGVIHSRSWYNPLYLNQGQTSACTGESRTYDLGGSPVPLRVTQDLLNALAKEGHTLTGKTLRQRFDQDFAQAIYRIAQKYDEWAGEDYEGSSVLGALKACAALGLIGEYRWAFNIDDMCSALSTLGPVVVGTTWYNSMFDPRPSGALEIDPSSGEAGGHAYCFRRILATKSAQRAFLGHDEKLHEGVPLLIVRNSWWTPFDNTAEWGRRGEAGIWADDYERSLFSGGEQSIVTDAWHDA